MGVDRPGGRAPLGRGGVAATPSQARRILSWLGAPMRTDRVELSSARPAAEVRARIKAASRPVSGNYAWYKGRSVVVRRHRGETIRLALARTYGAPWRPEASVLVEPAGSGARVAAEIGPSTTGRFAYVWNGIGSLLVTLVLLLKAVTTRDAELPVDGLLLCFAAVGIYTVFTHLAARDRAMLRALLAHAVS